jgi:hypothetical protein
MKTLEKLGVEKGQIVGDAFVFADSGTGIYRALPPRQALDRNVRRSSLITPGNTQAHVEISRVVGVDKKLGRTTLRRLSSTIPGRLVTDWVMSDGPEIYFDPAEGTPDDLSRHGIIIEPSTLHVTRLPQRSVQDYLAGAPVERRGTAETRPLGPVSDFVTEELPEALEEVRMGRPRAQKRLLDAVTRRLTEIDDDTINTILNDPLATEAREIAGLDLSFLRFALAHSGVNPPERLNSILARFSEATGQPLSLTLERLVSINPLLSDPRLFSPAVVPGETRPGKRRSTELGFYLGISSIEELLGIAYENFNSTRRFLPNDYATPEEASTTIARGTDAIHKSAKIMEAFKGLNPEDFNRFRVDHTPIDTLQGKDYGPSGAYSTLTGTEILLAAEFLSGYVPNYYGTIKQHLSSYPVYTRDLLKEAVLNDGRLSPPSLVWQARNRNNPALLAATREASDAMRHFRGVHWREGRRTGSLPEVFNANGGATRITSAGLEDPGAFLKGNLSIRHGFW